jgi:WD repeat-containing protein 40A
VQDPLVRKKEHALRIRSLCYSKHSGEIFTLGGEGMMKSWDSERFEVSGTYELPDREDPVCIAMYSYSTLLAIGSQYYISLLDPRQQTPTQTIPSLDSNWGVRSVCFNNHLLTIGGGKGRIAFIDTRKMEFLPVGATPEGHLSYFHQTGSGWLPDNLNPLVLGATGLTRSTVLHAAQTLCYDPSGTRLFVAGGPLLTGLDGSYAALW